VLESLLPLAVIDLLAIAVKAAGYLAFLLAAGSALVLGVLPHLPGAEVRFLRRLVPAMALLAAALAATRLSIEAVILAGDDWDAFFDVELIMLMLEGPAGLALGVQGLGLLLLMGVLLPGVIGVVAGLLGALAVATGFGLTGHTAAVDGWLLNALIIVHLLGLSFWVGIFLPLYRVTTYDLGHAGQVAAAFGRVAIWVVPILVAAGVYTFHQLTGGVGAAIKTSYGQLFAIKIVLFSGVFLLAAINKLSLTPALARGERLAPAKMRRSLTLESLLILAILVATASFTTLTGPQG